jgi:Lon protease-like protein
LYTIALAWEPMARSVERFPLFPLGLVLLPGESVPLHIFEERYKLREVGCSARITRVLERFDDGRLNILVEGTTPFRLERRIGDLPYPAGDVELLEDESDADDAALDRTRSAYADLVERVTDARPDAEALAQLDAYGMAATLEIAPAAKQALLELRSEAARLEQLEALFAEALKRIETAARVAEQASGNGHLRPGG